MVNRILVGIDGSKIGVHIVDIRLLETPFIEDLAGALGFTTYSEVTPKLKEVLDERGRVILDQFAKRCREAGADCSIAQAFGIVANELVVFITNLPPYFLDQHLRLLQENQNVLLWYQQTDLWR